MHADVAVERGGEQELARLVDGDACDGADGSFVRVQRHFHVLEVEGEQPAGGGADKDDSVAFRERVEGLVAVVDEVVHRAALLAVIVEADVTVARAGCQARFAAVGEAQVGVPHRHLQLQVVVRNVLRRENFLLRLQVEDLQVVRPVLAADRHQLPVLRALPHLRNVVARLDHRRCVVQDVNFPAFIGSDDGSERKRN